MSIAPPVIGSIRSLDDCRRALENIRNYFLQTGGIQNGGGVTIIRESRGSVVSPEAGLPSGGSVGQFLQKKSNVFFDTEWSFLKSTDISDLSSLDNKAVVVYESGDILYVCKATIGSALGDAVWQIKKVDTSSDDVVIITWCDGDDYFDNLATNLEVVAALSYS
jgi:hypothetical protein